MDKKRMAFLDQRCPSRTVGGAIQTLTSMKTQTEETRTSERVLEDSNICMPPSNNLQPSTDSDGQPEVSNSQSEVSSAVITGHKWATGFKPRSLTDHMRNCSLIGHDVRALMVQRLTSVLLTTENYVEVKCLRSCRGEVVSVDRLRWNLGGVCVGVCVCGFSMNASGHCDIVPLSTPASLQNGLQSFSY